MYSCVQVARSTLGFNPDLNFFRLLIVCFFTSKITQEIKTLVLFKKKVEKTRPTYFIFSRGRYLNATVFLLWPYRFWKHTHSRNIVYLEESNVTMAAR